MYPQEVDKFTEKLNKIDGNTYVIEEEVTLTDGIYEGELEHDNVSLKSINVYTGSKLTGEKIQNFIVSTPSKTPWKNTIKIFVDLPKVYITYETQGDTVEADDINKVQESITNTQKEVTRYKATNDTEVSSLKNRATLLENNKSEKTYVDTELNKRYLKTETYTKTETDQRIQMVINAAPEALDTLKELADALNNDPNFAATITTQLSGKVDKISGKQLSTEDYSTTEKAKLAGVENEANKYIHPSTHSVSMITGLHDVAVSGDYNNLKNKPTSLPPAEHNHDDRYYTEAEANNKFAPGGYGLGVALSEVTVSNSNNAIITGMYYAVSSDPNKPTGVQDGALFVMAFSSLWITQLYFDWRTNKSYKRVCSSGTWGAWDTLMSIKAANTWNNLRGV